ncbi:MAG: hypothetical protein AAB508_01900, partial [Patescibacteria group bacterium]
FLKRNGNGSRRAKIPSSQSQVFSCWKISRPLLVRPRRTPALRSSKYSLLTPSFLPADCLPASGGGFALKTFRRTDFFAMVSKTNASGVFENFVIA